MLHCKRLLAFTASLTVFVVALMGSPAANAVTASPPFASWPHRTGTYPLILVNREGVPYGTNGWPIYHAAQAWGVRFRVTTSCRTGVPCVRVSTERKGDNNNPGHAVVPNNGTSIVPTVRLVLNQYYMRHYGYQRRLDVVMHELGHTLGLDHDNSGGCMYPYSGAGHAYVSSFERHELEHLYGVS